MHGKARAEGNVIRENHIPAPICADCHQAHEVTAVAAGEQLRATCLNCHDDAPLAHDKWLPNSALHLSIVSCPACHSPLAERTIDLELYDKVAQVPVGQNSNYDGLGERMDRIEKTNDGLDALGLWKLVRESSREGKSVDVTLTLRGRKKYYPANNEILSSVASVDSVNDFYAMGGTRIKLLDGLLILLSMRFTQVFVGSGDQPDIDGLGAGVANCLELPLFNETKQFSLGR